MTEPTENAEYRDTGDGDTVRERFKDEVTHRQETTVNNGDEDEADDAGSAEDADEKATPQPE